ncbi:MAG: RNA ligase family protein [Thermodesulfobacteriota bacterium]
MKADDMPKLLSPFKREWRDSIYVVTPTIEEGYNWVFEDPTVMAVEKLDGTNVSVVMNGGQLVGLWNRTQPQMFDTLSNNRYIEGVRNCPNLGHALAKDGQHFGELMGPKIQKNFLKLDETRWYPFEYLKEKATYRSYHKYPKTFENISNWFKTDLFSLVYQRKHSDKVPPEGIVFHHPDGRMAKLRRDMFDWYEGKRHHI